MIVFKPIRIFWQKKSVSSQQIKIVVETIHRFLKLAETPQEIKIEYGGALDLRNFKGSLFSRWGRCLDARNLIDYLAKSQKEDKEKYYSLLLVKNSIFFQPEIGKKDKKREYKKEKISGLTKSYSSAVIFVDKASKINNASVKKAIQFITFHELGHVFGLIPEQRIHKVILSYGEYRHCGNHCAMHPKQSLFSNKKPFCLTCLWDLRAYFQGSNLVQL